MVSLSQNDMYYFNVDLCRSLANNLVLESDVTLIAQNGSDNGRKRKEILKVFNGFLDVS